MYMHKDNQREAVEVAYIAGLIDGEGTIRIQKHQQGDWNPKYCPTITFTNTNIDSVKLVQDFFRGRREIREHVGGTKAFHSNKVCYRAHRGGRIAVANILMQLLPYLRIKKKQAELILEFDKNFQSAKGIGYRDGRRGGKETLPEERARREDIYQQVTSLNRYGTRND